MVSVVRGVDSLVVSISACHAGSPSSILSHSRHDIYLFCSCYIHILYKYYIILFLDCIDT